MVCLLRQPAVATWQATFIISRLNLTYISIYQPRLCQFYKRKPRDNKSFGAQLILHTSESVFTRWGGFNQQKASEVLFLELYPMWLEMSLLLVHSASESFGRFCVGWSQVLSFLCCHAYCSHKRLPLNLLVLTRTCRRHLQQ